MVLCGQLSWRTRSFEERFLPCTHVGVTACDLPRARTGFRRKRKRCRFLHIAGKSGGINERHQGRDIEIELEASTSVKPSYLVRSM